MGHGIKIIVCYACTLIICWHVNAQQAKSNNFQTVLQNPVFNEDFPDPTVIKVGNTYYAYATQSRVNGAMWNIQVASSVDLQNWEMSSNALPVKPVWAKTTQDFWAPHVLYDRQLKKFVLFYSAESDDTAIGKCLAVAFADEQLGPFTDKGTPLLCGKGFMNIDPMAFVDPKTGKKLLYWGSDFQPLKVQEMSDDWKSFKPGSVAKPVIFPDRQKNYNRLIEGAWLDFQDGKYFLYYSGDNCCGDGANYAVMVAKADNPFGPFVTLGKYNKSGSSVILEKDEQWIAPGHNSIFRDDNGDIWMAYHAINRKEREEKRNAGRRVMCISRVIYKDGWPKVVGQN
jgi:arabinan endo-1,5-alpha-L-arabinosidase